VGKCTDIIMSSCTRIWEVQTTLYFRIYCKIVVSAHTEKWQVDKKQKCFPASKQTTAGPQKRGQRLLLTHTVITGRKGRHAGAWACTWQCLAARFGCAILICQEMFLEGNRNSRKAGLQHRRKKNTLRKKESGRKENGERNIFK